MYFSFPKLVKFSAIMSSNMFFATSSFSSHSGTPIMRMLLCLMLSQRSLKLFPFFKILCSFFCLAKTVSTTLSSTLLICSYVSSNLLLIHSSLIFSSFIIFFISVWFFFIFSNSFLLLFSLCSSTFCPELFEHLYDHHHECFIG